MKNKKRGLPPGCTIDDVLTFPEEAAIWFGVSEDFLRKRQDTLPGVIIESERAKFFHPRTYLDVRLRRFKRTYLSAGG